MSRRDLKLEHTVVKTLKPHGIAGNRLLLAVSGGVDSMVMAEILHRWSRNLGLELIVAHVHHGGSQSPAQAAYRQNAQSFVKAWARERGLKFVTNRAALKKRLKTEQEFREYREGFLHVWRQKWKADFVAFAHHREDLLETRVLRLIRGTGAQGIAGMSVVNGEKLRPLMTVSRAEIEEYARLRNVHFVEDPSNENLDPFRNWLRREWLPHLEKRQPGALKSLSRSLHTLVATVVNPEMEPVQLGDFVGLRRESLRGVSSRQQAEMIARYFRSLGLRNYAQTHVEEVMKRLSTKRRAASFELLGLEWKITPDLLWASRV